MHFTKTFKLAQLGGNILYSFAKHKISVTTCYISTAQRVHLQRQQRNFSKIMSKPKVYVTRVDIPKQAIEILENNYEVSCWKESTPIPRSVLIENIRNKQALFCVLTDKIDKEVLDAAGSQLKIVATMSVGYDHLDVKEIKSRRIKIGYTPDILTDATAELTVALLLCTSRRLLEAHKEAISGGWTSWSPMWMCGPSLSGSTVGIYGFGRIGQAVGRRLKGFGVGKFLYYNRSNKSKEAAEFDAKKVTFDELLSQSDFVIACCAFTPETKEIFNMNAFKKMKKTAIFINTSRGGVVHQEDLVKCLQNDTILAAGLDVTTPEPLPLDHDLYKLKNCVVLPHIGSATNNTRIEMAVLTANNIVAGLKGEKMPAELN